MRSEALVADTIKLYKSNFIRGFDLERFRSGYVILWTILGLLGSGTLGAAGTLIKIRFGKKD